MLYTILVSESFLLEGIEHVRKLYKSWAYNKSGNPEAAMAIMDDVLKHQKMLPKKDFAKYSSYDELERDYDRITLKLQQKELSSDVDILYEDEDLLVVVPKTWQASCKYGANTKWCTAAREDPKYWDEHQAEGLETFWIYKNLPDSDPNHKWSHYYNKLDDNSNWYNAINRHWAEFEDIHILPKQHPKYDEIIEKEIELLDSKVISHLDRPRNIGLNDDPILPYDEIINPIVTTYIEVHGDNLMQFINSEFEENDEEDWFWQVEEKIQDYIQITTGDHFETEMSRLWPNIDTETIIENDLFFKFLMVVNDYVDDMFLRYM